MKPLDQTLKVATIVCPGINIPDIVGAHSIFCLSPNVDAHLVYKKIEQVEGFPPRWPVVPTATFSECGDVDVLIVGATDPAVFLDAEVIAFCREKAKNALAVIGICAGALILGAAGLLEGRRATTNLQLLDVLAELGASPVPERMVVDGKFYTSGPVLGSFEAALRALVDLRGEETAKMMEFLFDYAPNPLFKIGSSDSVIPKIDAKTEAIFEEMSDLTRKNARAAYKTNKKV